MIRDLYDKIMEDSRFDVGKVEMENIDDVHLDFHGVADFSLVRGCRAFAINPVFEKKRMLDVLDFLEENGIKKFTEVTLFDDSGQDYLQVKEAKRDYMPKAHPYLTMKQVRWLIEVIER